MPSSRTLIYVATVIALATGLTGCTTPPKNEQGQELSSSDYGEPPADPEAAVRAFLRDQLKDPMSAQVQVLRGPTQFWNRGGIFGPAAYGWGICYEVNAKNGFGAYTGFRKQFIIWRDGRVRNDFGVMSNNSIDAAMAKAACDKI